MIEPELRKCEVCHRVREVWVAAGALGPYSIARCRECLEQYAEPIWAVEATLAMSRGMKGLASFAKEIITWHPRKNQYVSIGSLHEAKT